MSIEISEIDLQRYCQKTFWTIHEAICITLHTNPRDVYVELPYYSERYRDVFWNEFKNLENLISESSEKKELIIKFNTYSHIAPKVKVIDYISWVKKKELPLPERTEEFVENANNEDNYTVEYWKILYKEAEQSVVALEDNKKLNTQVKNSYDRFIASLILVFLKEGNLEQFNSSHIDTELKKINKNNLTFEKPTRRTIQKYIGKVRVLLKMLPTADKSTQSEKFFD